MQRIVFVFCFFGVLVDCEEQPVTCGGSNDVLVYQSENGMCAEEYNNSNILQFFGSIDFKFCSNFLTADFSNVPSEFWASNFTSCTDDQTLSINIVIYQLDANLQVARCFKSGNITDNTCVCRMDCLLQFESNNVIVIYLKDIGCSEEDFSTSLNVYRNSPNVVPVFQWKTGYLNCTTQVISSSVVGPTLSSVSSVVPGGTIATSATTGQPMCTGIPPACVDYDIKWFNSSEAYCSCDGNDTLFKKSLQEECSAPSSSTRYFIELLSGQVSFSSQTLVECAGDCPISKLFDSTVCSSGQWNTVNVSCECSSQTDSSSQCSAITSSTPHINNCVFKFSSSESSVTDSVVFIRGLDYTERDTLLAVFDSCPGPVRNEILNCSVMSTSTSPSSVDLPGPESNFFNHSDIQLVLGVGGGALILAISLFVAVCILVVVKRRRHADSYGTSAKSVNGKHISFSTAAANPSPLTTTSFNFEERMDNHVVQIHTDYSKWKRIFSRQVVGADQIVIMETIGEGAFGLVQKGELRGKNERCVLVAIKAMKGASTPEQIEEFISESAIMLDFDHPNVLGLLGVCFDTNNGLPLIILPYMSNGDLKTYLQNKRRGTPRGNIPEGLSIILLMRMCLEISKGMAYLARRKFVHRDLAARNCMVDENLICRVADFGLSRDVYSKDYYRLERRVKLPVKWLPPECLHDSIFNEKTDVWSFGVTCWEVFSLGRTPYPGIDNADIVEYIEQGYRLKKPPLCPKEVYLLISRCWDESPEIRPCFTILVESLRTIVSNWEGHDSTLKRQLENELQSSLEQDGFESDSQELECSGSMATRFGSFGGQHQKGGANFRKNTRSQRISSSSSLGTSTINSRTALLGNFSTGSPVVPGGDTFTTSGSHFDGDINNTIDPCIQHGVVNHDYYNSTSSQSNSRSHCSTSSLNVDPNFDSSAECSGKSTEEAAPNVPIFEMFYDDNHKPTSSQKLNTIVPSAIELELSQRSASQSSCLTEETNLPDTPMERRVPEPAEYSLPVKIKTQTLPNGIHDKGGLKMSSRDSSRSSYNHSSRSSRSQTTSSSHTSESPTAHFYFTLDPSVSLTPVFDCDTSSDQNTCDTSKSRKFNNSSNSSESESPILAYQPQKICEMTSSAHANFYPSVSSTEGEEDDTINGFTPHRHLVLNHTGSHGQKFDSELSP